MRYHKRVQGHAVANGHHVAEQPRPKIRRVSLRAVDCPDCPAELGEPCLTAAGKVLPGGHRARKRLATRLDNESRNQVGLP